MFVYLDTEFNGVGGGLISLALVPGDPEWHTFYAVREIPEQIDPWVAANVIPVLQEKAIGKEMFRSALWGYLVSLPRGVTIVADWPEDIAHLCREMCAEGGKQVMFFPSFFLINSGECHPTTPHNALSDAEALRAWHMTAD